MSGRVWPAEVVDAVARVMCPHHYDDKLDCSKEPWRVHARAALDTAVVVWVPLAAGVASVQAVLGSAARTVAPETDAGAGQ